MAADYSPQQVSDLLSQGAIQLIDVRQPHEHKAGRIAGGRLIELGQLSAEAQTIDRSRPVVFYCRAGTRSTMAAQAFRASGYEAYSMSGGLVRWAQEARPLSPEGAEVADH